MSKSLLDNNYNAAEIEILEGLEPVRHRPGMYIGGIDNNALHHLAIEIIDNSMDEVVAKHATVIDVKLSDDNILTISDNGRGRSPHSSGRPLSGRRRCGTDPSR